MNMPESAMPEPPSSNDGARHLHETVARMQKELQAGLAAVILLALGLNYFLFKEQSITQQQRMELEQVMNEYSSKGIPQMNEVLAKFREYAKTHPDFRPVVERYFPLSTNQAPSTVPPTSKQNK
jgi:hypothetical protein